MGFMSEVQFPLLESVWGGVGGGCKSVAVLMSYMLSALLKARGNEFL